MGWDLNLTTYPWDEERMEPDVDAACKTIREVQPKVACSDNRCSCFPPLEEMAAAAKEVGASVMYDGARARFDCRWTVPRSSSRRRRSDDGIEPQNLPRSSRRFLALISDDPAFQRRLNNAMFPGVCSSYHLHHVAGR